MSRYWGWFERALLVVVLLLLTVIQIGVASKVYADAGAQVTEVFSVAFNVIGLFILVMLVSALSGSVLTIIRWVWDDLSESSDRLINCGIALFGAAVVGYNGLTMGAEYPLNPEFATVEVVYTSMFVILFVVRARPLQTAQTVWRARQEPTEVPA